MVRQVVDQPNPKLPRVRNSEKMHRHPWNVDTATLEIGSPEDLLRLEVLVQGPHFQMKYGEINDVLKIMLTRKLSAPSNKSGSVSGFEPPDKSLSSKMQLRRMEAQNSLGSSGFFSHGFLMRYLLSFTAFTCSLGPWFPLSVAVVRECHLPGR